MEFHSQRVSIIKLFVNKYRWTGRNYLSKIDDWETFEKNNPNLTLNMLYIKEKEICPALPFKNWFELWKANNSINDSKERQKRLALPSGKKKISEVLRGITPRLFLLLKLSLFFCTLNQMKKYEKIKPFVKM